MAMAEKEVTRGQSRAREQTSLKVVEARRPQPILITQETFDRLVRESPKLKDELPEAARYVFETNVSEANPEERSEHERAISRVQEIGRRLKEIDEIKKTHELIRPSNRTDRVRRGVTVVLEREEDVKPLEITLVGSEEDTSTGREKGLVWLSFNSPLGKSILGKQKGETVSFIVEDKKTRQFFTNLYTIGDIVPGRFDPPREAQAPNS